MPDAVLEQFPEIHFPSYQMDFDLAELAHARENSDQLHHKWRVAQRNSRQRAGLFQAGAGAVDCDKLINRAEAETLASYATRGARLFKDFRRETQIPADNEEYCVLGFAEWLLAMRQLWAPGTWRSVRAAAGFHISKIPDNDAEEAGALVAAAGQRLFRGHLPGETMLSFLPESEFSETKSSILRSTRSADASRLVDWMLAAISTGLGPEEWKLTNLVQDTDIDGNERTRLFVFDLQWGRPGAPGSYRTLDVSALSPDVRIAIRRMSEQGRVWYSTGEYANRKHAISRLLSKTFSARFPQKQLQCALESLQYQAIANFQTVYQREEISALLGDVFVGLEAPNYAHRDRSWAAPCKLGYAKADDRAINRFRRILSIYDDRKVLKDLGQLQHSS